MKIGFFTDSYKPYISGVVKSIDSFTAQLEEQGHQVFIFAPDYPGAGYCEKVYRFKSLPAPTYPSFRLAIPFSNGLLQEVSRLNLDLIHTHSPFLMGWLGRYVARKMDIPLVFTYHTLYEEYVYYFPIVRDFARKLAIKYSKDYCQSCDLVITPSQYVNNKLRCYRVSTLLKTISTGVDLQPYRDTESEWVREKYQLNPAERLLLFVGRLGREKNIRFLLTAFKTVTESLNNVKLLLVGDGPDYQHLTEESERMGLRDRVIFAGWQAHAQVIAYYLAADLFVFPSVTETQGLVTIEAMAGGLPVIAVDAAGSSDMVDDGVNGLLVKHDSQLFALSIIDLLTNDTRYKVLRKNALKKAEEYSIQNMTKRLLAGYREACNYYYHQEKILG